MITAKEITNQLPYSAPFLFVDELTEMSDNGIKGNYTFKKDEYFYTGHFKNNPVTPGVILTEVMAQIGLVCFGIYLLSTKETDFTEYNIALSSAEVEFLKPVFPGEKVTVISTKKYFRFNKLKCNVAMRNNFDQTVCTGTIAGIILKRK